jgi:hypothetical protein
MTFTPSSCFFFLFIIIYCSEFTLFFLCYGFLISLLFQSVSVLYSTTIFLCHPTMHMLSVTYTSTGLGFFALLLFCCCGFIYLIIIYCTFFPFLSPAWLMQTLSRSLPSHVSEFLPIWNVSLQSCTFYYTPPPSQLLPPTLLSGTTLLRTYHCPHYSLYTLCSWTASFPFGFLILEYGTKMLSRNVSKKLPLLAV